MNQSARLRRFAAPVCLLAAAAFVLSPVVAGGADDLRDLVEEVLDQQAENVQIVDVPLRQALAKLGQQTGLRFVLDEVIFEFMPYGQRTRVAMDLEGVTLRNGLRRLLDGLGLSMRVEGGSIRVAPAPVLDRLGRRMTINEVHLLHALASRTWAELDQQRRPLQFRALSRANPRQAIEDTIAQIRGRNALEQLEAATTSLGWYWVPQEDSILIYSRTEEIWRRLERLLDLDYQSVPLEELLIDLCARAGITVFFEPGVLERIRADQRSVDLIHRQTTVSQTLARICGSTGTCFEVTDYGVLIGTPVDQPSTPRPPSARVVAILRIPVGEDGATIDFPYYEDNLPPEFQRLLERKLPEVIEELRRRERG